MEFSASMQALRQPLTRGLFRVRALSRTVAARDGYCFDLTEEQRVCCAAGFVWHLREFAEIANLSV